MAASLSLSVYIIALNIYIVNWRYDKKEIVFRDL